MDERIAMARLQNHIRVYDEDGKSTPLFDEACLAAYQALNNHKWLREKLIEYEKNPTNVDCQELVNDLYKVFVYGWKNSVNTPEKFSDQYKMCVDRSALIEAFGSHIKVNKKE